MIKAGLGVNAINYNLESSVMLAARNNHQAAVELLLSGGAKMHIASVAGFSQIMEIIFSPHRPLVDVQNVSSGSAPCTHDVTDDYI